MKKSARLPKIDLIESSGLLFIALDDQHSEEFSIAVDKILSPMRVFQLKNLKVAEVRTFLANVDWPLFVQNFVECYHCYEGHTFLRHSESFVELAETGASWKIRQLDQETGARAIANGKPVLAIEPVSTNSIYCSARTSTLKTDSETADGKLIGKPLGNLPIGDRSFIFGVIGPLTHFTLLPDQLVIYSFDPIASDRTKIKVTWLVHPETCLDENAKQNMVEFWSKTINEDIALTEAVQKNANSRFMSSPNFTLFEKDSRLFTEWLKRNLK